MSEEALQIAEKRREAKENDVNKLKDKNHMIISIDEEKAYDKIRQQFMIKNPPESRNRGNMPQHNKNYMWQTHSKHYPQWWKIKSISPKVRNKARVPLSPLLFNIVLEVLATEIRAEKAIKGIQIGKEEIKLSLFADDMILYIENPKDFTRKVLELINEYSKVSGYKINTEKSLAFLYTNNEKTEREIKEIIPFTILTKRIKYLGINLRNKRPIYSKL